MPTIHIDQTTESLWQKDDVLCLVGPEGVIYYELLNPGETVNAKRYQQQLTDLNRSFVKEKARITKDATQSHCSS